MNFVNRNGRIERLPRPARGQPFRITPRVTGQVADLGRGSWAQLGGKSVWVGFLGRWARACGVNHVLVEAARLGDRHERRPNA